MMHVLGNSVEDICEIIRLWEEEVLRSYNQGILTAKQYDCFNDLYFDANGVNVVKERLISKAGITIDELIMIYQYKRHCNKLVHRKNMDAIKE